MKRETIIKTKRLILRPVSMEELTVICDNAEDETKDAYGQMLKGAENDPENSMWYVPWSIISRKEDYEMGYIGFKGPVSNDAVEIGYGILPEYEGNGYTTEAVKALVKWALEKEEIFFVEAEALETNVASIRVLEKSGFMEDGYGEEGRRFVIEKPPTNWMPIGVCLGVSVGYSMGNSIYDNISIGMCFGIAVGVAIGAALDNRAKKALSDARNRRNKKASD